MPVHREAVGRELLHIAGAGMHVEDPAAATALEVVVVLVADEFVAGRLAWQLDGLDLSCFQQLLDIAVNGSLAKGWHVALGLGEDLRREQRTTGRFHDRADRVALAG